MSCDRRTNSAPGLRAAQNDIAAPITQRSTFFIRSLRSAAGMKTDGSTSWPCSSSMRTSTSNMPRSSPTQARDRLLHQAEAVLHQRRLDLLHPEAVLVLQAQHRPGVLEQLHAVAAHLAALAVRHVARRSPGLRVTCTSAGTGPRPIGAGRRHRFRAGLEHLGRDLVHDVLRPGLDVLRVAALDEQHEAVAAETAGEVARLELLAQQAREVGRKSSPISTPSSSCRRLVLVGLDVGDAAHAALGRLREARAQLLDEVAPVQEAGRGVATASLPRACARTRRRRATRAGTHDLHAGLAVEFGAHQLELERRMVAAHDEGGGVQRVADHLPCMQATSAPLIAAWSSGSKASISGVPTTSSGFE